MNTAECSVYHKSPANPLWVRPIKGDNSIELSYLQWLEFRGYLRQLEGLYRQKNTPMSCECNEETWARIALPAFLDVLWVRCCCFQCQTGTYIPGDTGGRCDTFISITRYKIFNDKVLYVLLSQSLQVTRNGTSNAIHIQNHCSQNKYSKCWRMSDVIRNYKR